MSKIFFFITPGQSAILDATARSRTRACEVLVSQTRISRPLPVSKRDALSDKSRFRSLISCISNERPGPLEHETPPCYVAHATVHGCAFPPHPLGALSLSTSHLLACQCPVRHSVHGTSPSCSPLTLICNARSANGRT